MSFSSYLHIQLLCAGEFYEQWMNEKPKLPIYAFFYAGGFILTLIMSVFIFIAKKFWQRNDQHINLGIQIKKQIKDFGGLKTSWVCCIPAGMSVLVLTKINKFHPFELNEYPNSLYIYYVHILNPTLIVLPLVIFHFSRDKELRRAAKSTICPMPPVREDEEGCAPPIYKV